VVQAVLRLDASTAIGGGHAVRCVALADALREDGWQCTFVVAEPGADTVRRFAGQRHEVRALPRGAALDAAATMATVPAGCELLVIDHYGWSAAQESACRGWARRILVIDDLCDRPHDCDLLLDMSLPDDTAAAARRGRNGTMLLGPGFALLRSAFARQRMRARARAIPPRRIFVNFGLMDEPNLAGQSVQALREAAFDGAVNVVLGSQSPHLAGIQALGGRTGPAIRVHVEPDDLVALMADADLALGAAGGSAWERCSLGLPSIAVTAAANQERNARALASQGACELVRTGAELSRVLGRLLPDAAAMERMSLAAAAITDARGARRVALALRPERTRTGGQVTLRRLTPGDAAITHRWQQNPATRRHARNPAVPTRDEHLAWISRKLGDPGCVLDVVEHDGVPAGVVRLDRVARPGVDLACEVSINVATEFHGHGIGAAALSALRRLAPEAALIAHVLPGNAASHALFSKAGYVLDGATYVSIPVSD